MCFLQVCQNAELSCIFKMQKFSYFGNAGIFLSFFFSNVCFLQLQSELVPIVKMQNVSYILDAEYSSIRSNVFLQLSKALNCSYILKRHQWFSYIVGNAGTFRLFKCFSAAVKS